MVSTTKDYNWDGKNKLEQQWTFPGAMLYSVTVVTTIGSFFIPIMTMIMIMMFMMTMIIAVNRPRAMRPIATDGVAWSTCVCVCVRLCVLVKFLSPAKSR